MILFSKKSRQLIDLRILQIDRLCRYPLNVKLWIVAIPTVNYLGPYLATGGHTFKLFKCIIYHEDCIKLCVCVVFWGFFGGFYSVFFFIFLFLFSVFLWRKCSEQPLLSNYTPSEVNLTFLWNPFINLKALYSMSFSNCVLKKFRRK